MADIRSYLKEKEKRDRKEQSYQNKIFKHRMSTVYRVALVILVIAAVAILLRVQYKNRVYTAYAITESVKRETVSNAADVRLGSSILTYSKDGAHCTDSNGKVLWNQPYEMQNPIVSVCGSVAAIGDYNGRTIYVQNETSQMGTINTNMPIRNLCVAANGVVGALLEDSDVTWIYMYDTKGNELVYFMTTMKKSGYPAAISISPSAMLAAVSYLYVDTGDLKSSVGFYNFGEAGKNVPDNFMGGYNYADVLIPYVQFMNNKNVFAVGDDRLVFYNGSQKPENVSNILFDEEVRAVYYSDQYVGLVFSNDKGSSRYRLDIYDIDGNKKQSKEFDLDYTDIVFDDNVYIIYNEAEVYISTINGMDKYEGKFEKAVKLLIPTGTPYKYMVATQDSIDMIQMK